MDHVVEVLGHQETAVRPLRIAARFLQGLHQRLIAFHAASPLHRHAGAQGLGKGVCILIGPADVIHYLALCLLLLLLLIAHVDALELFILVIEAAFLGQLGLGGVDLHIHLGHFAHQILVGCEVLLLEKVIALLHLQRPLVFQLQQFLIRHCAIPPYRNVSCSCMACAMRRASSSPASAGGSCGPSWPP